MLTDKYILGLCGSTRSSSSNLALLEYFKNESVAQFNWKIFRELDLLPHFNPDFAFAPPSPALHNFQLLVKNAAGIIISTPEYAMGVPGSLKNALDWLVGTAGLSGKKIALITASSLGEKAHASLLDTLLVLEADIPEDQRLLISFIGSKLNADGSIKDPELQLRLDELIKVFCKRI